jgi:hypothetical protein
VSDILWLSSQGADPPFNLPGLSPLATIAKLRVLEGHVDFAQLRRDQAFLLRQAAPLGSAPPCIRLSDGSGLWVRLGNAFAPGARDYCPLRRPAVYGP